MSRRFTLVTVVLTAVVAFMVGAIFAGGFNHTAVVSGTRHTTATARPVAHAAHPAGSINFADVVQELNASVVNIDSTARARESRRRGRRPGLPDPPDLFDAPFDFNAPRGDRDTPRRGAGSGFIIDADGSILTNNHVIERAERITVKLADGRTARAHVVGADPDTDIALIKVDGITNLPVAPLGDSSSLRAGEWVCAIGNPLGYEHTVTVGVVSYIGRKLFDKSLDNYIQTDAAINFGNSGGPLINADGEVVGINAAISSRASSIGFAVPINTATSILPQLRAKGRVSRGYIGVALTDVDPDLQRSLKLGVAHGALVQDITEGAPGERAGLRPYDVITSVDDRQVTSDDDLIREISARTPGAAAHLRFVRDGREQVATVKLAERPQRDSERRADASDPGPRSQPTSDRRPAQDGQLGLAVRDIDRATADRLDLPKNMKGVLITRVEPMSSAFDASIDRGSVILEINREHVDTTADFRRIAKGTHPGDIVTLYLYSPDIDQRLLKSIRIDDK